MIVDLPRRWRWGVAGLGVVVAILAAVFVFSTRKAEQVGARVVSNVPVSMPVPSVPVSSAPAAPEFVQAGAPGVDEVEVCRIGWVPVDSDGNLDETALADQIAPTFDRILATMRAEGGEMGRVAAGLLDPSTDRAAALDALARSAISTADPAVYGLAFQRCAQVEEGPCRMLSPARWSQLDPGNAAPWIFELADASQRGDKAKVQEALYQIAQARTNQSGYLSLLRAVMAAVPDDEASSFASEKMALAAMGLDASIPFPSFGSIVTACGAEAIKDSNRKQTCNDVAELLTERSDTLIARLIGARVGSRLGWPADRIDQMRGEQSLWGKRAERIYGESLDMSCGAVRRRLEMFRDEAAFGEVGGMRHWLDQSGTPAEDLVREGRSIQARIDAAPR